jgi:hypothetical protein
MTKIRIAATLFAAACVAGARKAGASGVAALLIVAVVTTASAARVRPDSRRAGSAPLAAARCQLILPVTVSPPRGHAPSSRGYKSSSGSASCTGPLGPWLTAGATGWASSAGIFVDRSRVATGGKNACVPTAGRGSLFAVVPRRALFHPPRVTLSGAFRFHRLGGATLRLNGDGRLVPTREAPEAADLVFSGTAAFAPRSRHACDMGRVSGTVTLEIVVHTALPATDTSNAPPRWL